MRGRPRKFLTNKERQKAYRDRKRVGEIGEATRIRHKQFGMGIVVHDPHGSHVLVAFIENGQRVWRDLPVADLQFHRQMPNLPFWADPERKQPKKRDWLPLKFKDHNDLLGMMPGVQAHEVRIYTRVQKGRRKMKDYSMAIARRLSNLVALAKGMKQ